MPDKNVEQSLKDVHEEMGKVEAEDDQTRDIFDRISHRIGELLEDLNEERLELREDLAEEFVEFGNALEDRYPGVSAAIQSAVRILSNAGV
jgi:hypothetical protein